MIELIKRYFIARNLCKRYGYKFRLFNDSNIYESGWMNTGSKEMYVKLNIDHFYGTLFHEIGHVVDYKIRGEDRFYGLDTLSNITGFNEIKTGIPNYWRFKFNNNLTSSVALREMLASRFAVKLLRKTNRLNGKAVRRLNAGYNSYLEGLPQHIYADASYKGFRKIGGCNIFYD